MNRKLVIFTILALLVSLFAPAIAGAQEGISDGQPAAARYSHRLIVELQAPALAAWAASAPQIAAAGPAARPDLSSPAAQQYVARLQAEQAAFVATMQRVIPTAQVATYLNEAGATVQATYQVVFDGVAVDAGRNADVMALRAQLKQLPGVKAVYLDFAHDPEMYASLPLINAEAAWNNVAIGGKSNAGAGVKFASMDGGAHHLAPMFDGTGYTYPAGFPKGDNSNNNGKIILSKVYFRSWDPPSPGDENAWPGVAGTSHGTHTSSTVAGNEVQASYRGSAPVTLSGVAPKAYIMSYRVFYNSVTNDGSFYNVEGIKALDDIAMDGADVLNNSWGGGPGSTGGEFDALDAALINAVKAGVFVSMSNGNAGPGLGTGDHPSADYINVAASTTTGTFGSGQFNVTAPEPVPATLKSIAYAAASFGATIPVGAVLGPFSYLPASVAVPANALGCNAFPAGTFAGKAAIISRGTCEFGAKALNAERAGAVFVVIFNSAAGGDALPGLGPGAVGGQVTIPVIGIGRTKGLALGDWYTANPTTAQFALDTKGFQVGNTPDVIADFSSRGPGVGLVLKPDIAAPGVNILAQGYGPGTGEARHLGFGEASGTSMAAPHVTGAAALIKQIHPSWSPAWIKSALMSTSKYLDIYANPARPVPAQPLDMGAGRLDLTNAADPGVILDPPSLSFGAVETGTMASLTVNVTNVAAAAETYALSTLYTGGGYASTTPVAGMTVEPASLTLAPGETKSFTVRWDTAAARGIGDNQGFVILAGSTHNAHLPAWMRVSSPSLLGKVLIIDNDGSSSLGLTDYAPSYTAALNALAVAYDVWDADAHAGSAATLPDATFLAQYPTIIYETGDNYRPNGSFTVPTPLTKLDMNRLVEYANGGGHLIAFGQDLYSLVNSDSAYATPSFYGTLLGAKWLQDSVSANKVFTTTAQLITGLPGTPFRNASFDISKRGDGAGNLGFVDEIKVGCNDPGAPDSCAPYQPLLKYSAGGTFKEDGFVALSHRDQPTLERPGRSFDGSSLYYSFGLEGVNSNTGFNTRADLVATSLRWSLDKGTAVITPTIYPAGRVTYFQATLTSDYGGPGVSYRWDFGDGTPFSAATGSATAGHTYAAAGTYTVRVEAANALGTRVIGAVGVTIPPAIPIYVKPVTQNFTAAADTYLAAGQPATNFGGWPFMYADAGDILRTAIRFNLSSIAADYPVDKATLSVYVDAFSGGGTTADLKVFGLTKTWAENTVTWQTPWTVAGGDFSATATASAAVSAASVGKWVTFDVTPLAQQWVANPAANSGALFRLLNPTSYTTFRISSREYWTPDKAPKLEVQYRTP